MNAIMGCSATAALERHTTRSSSAHLLLLQLCKGRVDFKACAASVNCQLECSTQQGTLQDTAWMMAYDTCYLAINMPP
jgi:hypothetical protein